MNSRITYLLRIGLLFGAVLGMSTVSNPAEAEVTPGLALPAPSQEILDAVANDPAYEMVNGAVLVTEPPILGPPTSSATADAPTVLPTGESVSQSTAMTLHSKPGADRVIFLDVDGHVVTGTAWNAGRADPIVVGSYSREPAGSENESFSDSELAAIVDIWTRVSEDFAPWDVDVTTEFPGDAALRKDGSDDQKYGAHVVITHDSGWYAPSGGVAYIGGFGNSYYTPAFVFSNHLAQGSSKSVAEAASHEVGHTLGLLHDGRSPHTDGSGKSFGALEYYSGHGDWGPIMGVGYSRSVTQWSSGQYNYANNTENDLTKIDSRLPGRAASSGPTQLPDGDSSTTATLETSGGTDTYQLDLSSGTASISLGKVESSGNLLAELTVTNVSSGATTVRTVVPPADPATWSHSIEGLTAGSYSIGVHSIGYGSAASGFSNYGSIGRYVLTVDVSGSTGPTTTTTTTTTTPPTVPDSTSNPPVPKASTANRLTSMTPVRLLDTREPDAQYGRLDAGDNIRVPVAGAAGIPLDARAAVINVVAVNPSADGFLSITPCTDVAASDRTSSLNFSAGTAIANSTIATLTDRGDLCIYSSAPAHVVVDVTGSLGPSGTLGLADTSVVRLADSRLGQAIPERLGTDRHLEIPLGGIVDETTAAVALNITAIRPDRGGYITVDDCGTKQAPTAALNFAAGEVRGNNGIFALSSADSICLTTTSPVDVTIDMTGEFRPDGLTFEAAEPVRLLDTRSSGGVSAKSSAAFKVPAPASDATATAASVNIASARHPRPGFITSWDCGVMPESSALNPVAGHVTANGALVALNSEGRSCLFHDAGGELIVDLNGWWI